jgi:hypothetical protein
MVSIYLIETYVKAHVHMRPIPNEEWENYMETIFYLDHKTNHIHEQKSITSMGFVSTFTTKTRFRTIEGLLRKYDRDYKMFKYMFSEVAVQATRIGSL